MLEFKGQAELRSEKLVTARGYVYTRWVELMPRIPEALTNSIVYLYEDTLASEQGEDAGGSGFLLAMSSEVRPPAMHVYAVTNAHVIETGCTCVRINLRYSSGTSKVETFAFGDADWVKHESHDLAVCQLPVDFYPDHYSISLIGTSFLVTEERFIKHNIGPGDELVYIGRFMGHAGKLQNLPSVRFGTISMNPNVDEPVEYICNGRQRKQVGFLVEARSRSGYSGSPVFFLEQHAINSPRTVMPPFDMCLLGVDWGHIPETIPITIRNSHGRPVSDTYWQAEVHSGMMGVVPSWYLLDFLNNSPKLIERRARDDEHYAKFKSTGTADA